MTYGTGEPDLMPGARNAIDVCLDIQPGERVAQVISEGQYLLEKFS